MRPKSRFAVAASLLFAMSLLQSAVFADSFTSTRFATGGNPYNLADSITLGDGSVWVAYTNGACSAGCGGSSTVIQYGTAGAVLNTYNIDGFLDGLQFDPTTGQVWALQSPDGNSALTVLDPTTHTLTAYSYAMTSLGMGFDDLHLTGGRTYTSQTDPAAGTDPAARALALCGLLLLLAYGARSRRRRSAGRRAEKAYRSLLAPGFELTGCADPTAVPTLHLPPTAMARVVGSSVERRTHDRPNMETGTVDKRRIGIGFVEEKG